MRGKNGNFTIKRSRYAHDIRIEEMEEFRMEQLARSKLERLSVIIYKIVT